MQTANLLPLVLVLAVVAYGLAYMRSRAVAAPLGGIRNLKALPFYYAARAALWCAIPALIVLAVWAGFEDKVIQGIVIASLPQDTWPESAGQASLILSQISNVAAGSLNPEFLPKHITGAASLLEAMQDKSGNFKAILVVLIAVLGATFAWTRVAPHINARKNVETTLRRIFFACAALAVLTTAGIVFSVFLETMRFFDRVPITEFLFGTSWSPQTAIRIDQIGSEGAFGVIPLFTGTLLISAIALLVAVPVGLLSAIYLSEYASKRMRSTVKPVLEMLAGIPTVVYGFFAALTVAPFIRELAAIVGMEASSQSALAAGLVMGIMIVPFVSSLSDDVISAVPQTMRDGSLALGATQSETMKKVIFPAALPGIIGGILLAASRAIGETMIVVMAAGLAANLTANPLDSVTTVTVQIATLLVGDQEFDSAKTLSAFALGMLLFIVTLLLNVVALKIVRKYREQYD
ncbi:phosphate ABC transporter permease subunit PstC [Marinobacter sp. M3C]|jgi:phosphate transport system permease protein|uniref:phosphate ABC transporter permease subunit PstC n=1 Tax=unclassified Marinobacter TaxID=83889 RepID=UPI00200E6A23|nr:MULTISPECIES: phosphate ABC transporter permease subunit PstC [unclassified Marinobacter]MCL1478115.1 phosphate ABC transporter permease subunit PstC [Marinobacter sp.]MCL1480070.1 phosphate ABC transporter permease subunit PstC [Marinobacter sp.]MCL1484051.1 phosphate ABC transporter permease subunit PstC [Marinobacter sp.]MCL1487582.1 phosphate ABC transporter permease subunit PstC [Marinobacter sp.]UQG55727.1 phosphate ABC transporter permease subunit PstC [Marinobacter sp. M4C]